MTWVRSPLGEVKVRVGRESSLTVEIREVLVLLGLVRHFYFNNNYLSGELYGINQILSMFNGNIPVHQDYLEKSIDYYMISRLPWTALDYCG